MDLIREATELLKRGEPLSHPIVARARRVCVDREIARADTLLARLAEVPGPGPGHTARRASDQRRYDELLAELNDARVTRDRLIEIELTVLADELAASAQRADEATQEFNRQLESFR